MAFTNGGKNIDALIHDFYHSENRNTKRCGNVWYQFDTLYSYAEPIAQIVREKNLVLVSSQKRSNTTSKHQSTARQYSPFTVCKVPCRPELGYIKRYLDTVKLPDKALQKNFEIFQNYVDAYNALEVFSANQKPYIATVQKVMAMIDIMAEKAAIASDKREAREAAKKAEWIKDKLPAMVAAWRMGQSVNGLHHAPIMLRIIKKLNTDDSNNKGMFAADTIETSWGASVPVTIAETLWELILRARKTQVEIVFTGDRFPVGQYTLDIVNTDGSIKVGCHNIAYSELELIAKQLNFI